jgi:hypothetical protein
VRIINLMFIAVFSLLTMSLNSEAKTIWNEEELKQNIVGKKVTTIYPVDGGVGGLEANQYGLASGEFIVIGPYEKIPDGIVKLAQENKVSIMPSQRFNDINKPRSPVLPLLGSVFYIFIFSGVLVVLILINKNLSTIIKILNKGNPPG